MEGEGSEGNEELCEVMAFKVNQAEEFFGPLTEPIARVPGWLREASAGLLKPGQEVVMHRDSVEEPETGEATH
jgi:hypothetical protein